MLPGGIDWHRTAFTAVLVVVGFVALLIAWKVTKLVLKLGLLLLLLALGAGLVLWGTGQFR